MLKFLAGAGVALTGVVVGAVYMVLADPEVMARAAAFKAIQEDRAMNDATEQRLNYWAQGQA